MIFFYKNDERADYPYIPSEGTLRFLLDYQGKLIISDYYMKINLVNDIMMLFNSSEKSFDLG